MSGSPPSHFTLPRRLSGGGQRKGDPPMKTRAAVAFEAKKPLEIVELDLEGPKAGEVLVEIMATGICHTDASTLAGFAREGMFPTVLGHAGAGIVREVGAELGGAWGRGRGWKEVEVCGGA